MTPSKKEMSPLVITRATLFPLGLIMAFCGGVFWFGQIVTNVERHGQAISQLDDKIDKLLDRVEQVQIELESIKAQVGDLKRPRDHAENELPKNKEKVDGLTFKENRFHRWWHFWVSIVT